MNKIEINKYWKSVGIKTIDSKLNTNGTIERSDSNYSIVPITSYQCYHQNNNINNIIISIIIITMIT